MILFFHRRANMPAIVSTKRILFDLFCDAHVAAAQVYKRILLIDQISGFY
jgi:hypothetical protein